MTRRKKPITRKHDGVFARNLHELLIDSGMTYTAAASMLKVKPNKIGRILNEGAMPGCETLMAVCDHFDVPLEILRQPLADLRAEAG